MLIARIAVVNHVAAIDLWGGDPSVLSSCSRRFLDEIIGTEIGALSGPTFVLAARAAADLARRDALAGRASDRPRSGTAAALRAFSREPLHVDNHSRRTCDRRVLASRNRPAGVRTLDLAVDPSGPRMGQDRPTPRRGVLPIAWRAGRQGNRGREHGAPHAAPCRSTGKRTHPACDGHQRDRGAGIADTTPPLTPLTANRCPPIVGAGSGTRCCSIDPSTPGPQGHPARLSSLATRSPHAPDQRRDLLAASIRCWSRCSATRALCSLRRGAQLQQVLGDPRVVLAGRGMQLQQVLGNPRIVLARGGRNARARRHGQPLARWRRHRCRRSPCDDEEAGDAGEESWPPSTGGDTTGYGDSILIGVHGPALSGFGPSDSAPQAPG